MVSDEIEFESGPFLHSLFGDEPAMLALAEAALGVGITARGGQLKLTGEPQLVERARGFFEESRPCGGHRCLGQAWIPHGDPGLSGRRGQPGGHGRAVPIEVGGFRRPREVMPRTLMQAEYVRAMERVRWSSGWVRRARAKPIWRWRGRSMHPARPVPKLVLTRPAVEAGEALGFLPGDIRKKSCPTCGRCTTPFTTCSAPKRSSGCSSAAS